MRATEYGTGNIPAQFGKVMSEIKPRMAVAYHFFIYFDDSRKLNEP